MRQMIKLLLSLADQKAQGTTALSKRLTCNNALTRRSLVQPLLSFQINTIVSIVPQVTLAQTT